MKAKSDKFLLEIQAKHSKSINLEISDEPQEYLTSEELNLDEKRLLFKLRSRIIDINNNFKSKYKGNLLCTFCDKEEETPKHLLKCKEVIEELNIDYSVKADDIFKD